MSAFNRRFDIKRVAGIQTPAWLGLVGMLISGVFALMAPMLLKPFCVILFLIALGVVVVVFYFGDDLPFRGLIFKTRQEKQLQSSINRLRY
ncbi:MAG: hypothetical protein ABUK13_09065 [Gammaproteobacteria bacterium]